MTTKAESYLLALSELENATGDIISSAVITLDGLIMASTKSDTTNNEVLAAYGAAAFKRAGETMEEFCSEDIDILYYESRNHRVITMRAGEHSLLIALTGKNVRTGMLIMNLKKAAQIIRDL